MGYQTWSNIPSRKIEMETGKQKKTKLTIFFFENLHRDHKRTPSSRIFHFITLDRSRLVQSGYD